MSLSLRARRRIPTVTRVAACGSSALAVAMLFAAAAHAFTASTAHGLIGFTVRPVGGPSAWCELDTGASVTVIDTRLARAMKLETEAPVEGHGAGAGSYPMAYVRTPVVLALPDGTRDTCRRAAVIDLSGVKTPTGAPLGVILGQDFLSTHVTTVDYDAARVTIHDATWDRLPTRATRVPIVRQGALPCVDIEVVSDVAPTTTERVLLDSGSEDAIDDSLLMADPGRRPTTTGVGLGQPHRGWFGRLREVRFAGVTFHDVPCAWPGRALLGGAVLRRFRVTLDEPHDAIWLEPGLHLHDSF